MVKRLRWYEQKNNILPEFIYGFRKGTGTEDLLNDLTLKIRKERERKKYVILINVDIAAAYDNVSIKILRAKLKKMGIPYWEWISNYLTNRKIMVSCIYFLKSFGNC